MNDSQYSPGTFPPFNCGHYKCREHKTWDKISLATEKQINETKWNGTKPGNYKCYLCGYKFKIGEYVRHIYCNGFANSHGNIWVCFDCDLKNDFCSIAINDSYDLKCQEHAVRFWEFEKDLYPSEQFYRQEEW
jgi:hypothetical protein